MREDTGGSAAGIDVLADATAPRMAQDRLPRFRELVVAAHVIVVGTGVDDVANRTIGQPPDRSQHCVRHLRRTGVHENDTRRTDLRGDVTASARDHVEVRPDRHHVETIAALLGGPGEQPSAADNADDDTERHRDAEIPSRPVARSM